MNDVVEELRDLVHAGPPGYRPPADPYARVAARIRIRRRRRVAATVGITAALTTGAVAGTPLVLGALRHQQASPANGGSAPGAVRLGRGLPIGYLIGTGRSGAATWRVYSTTATGYGLCLYAPALDGLYTCFDPPATVDWAPTSISAGSTPSTVAVVGVTNAAARTVRVQLRRGRPLLIPTVISPTSSSFRFFSSPLPPGSAISTVQALDGTGKPLGPALSTPPPTRQRSGCIHNGHDTACFGPASPAPRATR